MAPNAGPTSAHIDGEIPVKNLRSRPLTPTRLLRLILWLAFVAFHGIGVLFFGFTAFCYLQLPNSGLDRWLGFFHLGIGSAAYFKIALVHAVVAVVHAVFTIQMILLSIRNRQLVFSGSPIRHRLPRSGLMGIMWAVEMLKRGVLGIYLAFFTRDGLFGVYGPCFELVLLARELVETSLQTAQAYRMSRYLPRAWLNRLYVTLLVLNCWSTVFIHQIYHSNHAKRYFAALLCDFLLDWVSAVIVPSSLAFIYSKDIDRSTDDFFGMQWFNDTWLLNALNEFQMILVVSWADLTTRMVFALGMISNMQAVKRLVVAVFPSTRCTTEGRSNKLGSIVPTPQLALRKPQNLSLDPIRREASWIARANIAVKTNTALSRVLRAIFFSWGSLVLVFHILAELTPSLSQCKMQVRPWGVYDASCTYVIVDCYQENISGAREEVEALLLRLHQASIVHLAVQHCPTFEMPVKVNELHSLQLVKVYNTTISSWPSNAALTQVCHPSLVGLMMLRVNFPDGKIPLGLQSDTFPSNARVIGFISTNIRELPDDLHLKWPSYGTIHFDTAQFTEFPPVLMKLQPNILVLAGTPLTELPSELFEISSMQFLHVGETAISRIPDIVTSPSMLLNGVAIDGTNISYFPKWIDTWLSTKTPNLFSLPIAAAGTPYCNDRTKILSGLQSSFGVPKSSSLSSLMNPSLSNQQFLLSSVECVREAMYRYPLFFEDLFHGIH